MKLGKGKHVTHPSSLNSRKPYRFISYIILLLWISFVCEEKPIFPTPDCLLQSIPLSRMASLLPQKRRRACVIGGSGFLASLMVKLLLEKGYAVNTTVRNPEDNKKNSHLRALQNLGDLKVFGADLTHEESFTAPIADCDLVFHVATPVNFASQDPENDMIKPAIQGVHNVLKACAKAKTVKRVILTSSAAAVTVNKLKGPGLVLNEKNWTDVEFLTSEKPPTWGYPLSKTLAEKAAWNFAQEHNIDLITVIPTLMAGPSVTRDIPSSVDLATSLITGNEFLINGLKGMQMLSGSISITHVEDVCRAHVFLAEKASASGRYICCRANTSVPELAKFLKERYPHYQIPTDFGDLPSKAKLIISSQKLISEGFSFEHGIKEIYDQTLDFLKARGLLK
ncbi:anthocyanidin reductase ((2S)-flavan-3-ol-forming) isoform X1 [Ricinus communis]|uniref:anthocyanidin reductase ((2S)-flavan-3-ol-forming) isoform X1 n=1 Tax=Ricinus communis TaxID=3988 RepID=UPI00201A2B0E|nr:anthocyanidin reductase ((2S)-flavan-3-ol-forming) isoform X1 [Ricinus communis]